MLYGYGSVEETEEGNVTAVFIDTIKYNEPVDEPPDWAETVSYTHLTLPTNSRV